MKGCRKIGRNIHGGYQWMYPSCSEYPIACYPKGEAFTVQVVDLFAGTGRTRYRSRRIYNELRGFQRIGKESLKAGDHIYSWRTAYIYAHHGIYVGDNKVINFTRARGQEVGTGTPLDLFLVSSGPNRSLIPCPNCDAQLDEAHGVISSCLDCFLAGGVLYRFEYAVSPALFIAKARGGTCTLAVSDPEDVVVKRAEHLLTNGFRCYNVFKNNCEDFAIYCKTGLLAVEQGVLGQGGQAISIVGGPLAAVLSAPFSLLTNVYGMAATAVGVYSVSRYFGDISNRLDVVKLEVEDLTTGLTTGRVQLVENQMAAPIVHS